MSNETIRYTRNERDASDYPYITLFASFKEDKYFIDLQWNLENLFVNTYEREAFFVDAYPVDGDLVIVANDLQPFDHYHLTRATDYETYVMPNGMLLVDYYKNHMVDIHQYLDQRDNANKKGYVTRRYSDSLIDDVETKVSNRFEKMYVGIRCYDESGEPFVPSSGSVAISGVGIGGVEHSIGTLDASTPSPVLNVELPMERIVASPNSLDNSVEKWQLVIWQM